MNIGPETEYVEHKETTRELDAACASIAAMLNKHGRGEVFFGVRDDGEVVGQDVGRQTLRKVTQRIEQRVEPRVVPTVEPLAADDGRAYIRVAFEGGDGPYSCDGRFLTRRADEDVRMTTAQVDGAFRARTNRHDPWDGRPSARPVSDVGEDAVRAYVERGRAKNRIGFEYRGVADALTRVRLMDGGRLTNAADVMFCESRGVALKMGVFATPARVEVFDMRHMRGNLFELADAAEAYVMSNVKWRFEFTGDRSREEIPEIPRAAVREAVINALCHRDWQDDMAVQVDVFPTHVDIFNPGHFPPDTTPAERLSSDEPYSRSPNRLLAEALFQSGDIESHGTGIARMRELCEAAGVGLSYVVTGQGTILRFGRPDWTASSVRPDDAGAAPLPAHAEEVVAILDERGSLSAAVIAEELSLSRSQVQRILKKLLEVGAVHRSGAARSTVYSVHLES